MKLQFHKTILFSACLLACPSLMISQERPGSQPKPAQSEAESLNKVLTSQEEDLEQAHHRIAAIYREMAVISESDSASLRELKLQYARLAKEEESAALAAKTMAAYHTQLAAFLSRSAELTKHERYDDAAFRR